MLSNLQNRAAVTVRIELAPLEKVEELPDLHEDADVLAIAVTDTGIGIPVEKKLFSMPSNRSTGPRTGNLAERDWDYRFAVNLPVCLAGRLKLKASKIREVRSPYIYRADLRLSAMI